MKLVICLCIQDLKTDLDIDSYLLCLLFTEPSRRYPFCIATSPSQ